MPRLTDDRRRTRFVGLKMSKTEYAMLTDRVRRSRARSVGQYIRTACLRTQVYVPDYDLQHQLINAMTRCAAAISAAPPGPAKDAALIAAENAFDRIVP